MDQNLFYNQVPWHFHGVEFHHQPMQAASHLQGLEGQVEVRVSSIGLMPVSRGVWASCTKVDFAPASHSENVEMAGKIMESTKGSF